MKIQNIILESDCQEVIRALDNIELCPNWRISPLIDKVNHLKPLFNGIKWNWIPREANRVANAAAKLAKLRLCSQDWANRPPTSLISIYLEKRSMVYLALRPQLVIGSFEAMQLLLSCFSWLLLSLFNWLLYSLPQLVSGFLFLCISLAFWRNEVISRPKKKKNWRDTSITTKQKIKDQQQQLEQLKSKH
ncbi:putative ribonuclease H-like domain-containing protein [Rosa chinensis]|uniref:Putative ribonuclease H-like domain-containing protein n=1 Tax=Rosa chinensis TaxID=74649 RepID=A0A2P6QV41_ROSCH|nr:putative ribonuclease H-like domain-containing protein [Rosa chinensis]